MTVAIVTDSAASLPPELAARHRICVVPMWLEVDSEQVHDGDDSLAHIVSAVDVKTSGPSPGEFQEAIQAAQTGDGVMVLTISSAMSATFEAAVLAARLSDGPVEVIDTRTAAGAQALVVTAAAEVAAAGGSLSDVRDTAVYVIDRVRLVASVPTLEHLVRSGRVPGIAGWAADKLHVNPLFEFRHGEATRLRPAISRAAALDRIVQRCREGEGRGRLHVAALHALAPDVAAELLARATEGLEPAEAFVAQFSAVMVSHTGSGLAGLAWWWDER